MMNQVYKSLGLPMPDDDPILSLCVVEDPSRCPPGYYVVNRTHDQDSDADLYRHSVIFGKRNTRYLCLSKVHGIADLIVEAVSVVGEKDLPPAGYLLNIKTMDTDQKAWRKSQLCYKVMKRSLATTCITDIILLSRMKKAPEGFQLGGDINGLTLCFKTGPMNNTAKQKCIKPDYPVMPQQFCNLNEKFPSTNGNPTNPVHRRAPVEKPPVANISTTENFLEAKGDSESPHEYEKLIALSPKRPAPKPPVMQPSRPAPKLPPAQMSTYATLSSYQGLEGVPFVLNPRLQFNVTSFHIPPMRFRTVYELEKEFDYDFRVERQT